MSASHPQAAVRRRSGSNDRNRPIADIAVVGQSIVMKTSTMIHSGACDFCDQQGWVGFYLCGDGQTLVLLCDECDTVYVSPLHLNQGAPDRLEGPPDYVVKSLNISIAGGRDATREEIIAMGWDNHIVGEYVYQVKGRGRP